MDQIIYRQFRNSDLPGIVRVWNDVEVFTKFGPKMNWVHFSQYVLSKPYFAPELFLVAVDTSAEASYPHDGRVIGFIHGGFSPNAMMNGINREQGCVAMLAMEKNDSEEFRKSVAAQLLKHLEEAFRLAGTKELTAGAVYPDAPFYFGIFIGGESPGLYEKNIFMNSLLKKNGYEMHKRYSIHQVNLDEYHSPMTLQKKKIRDEYELHKADRFVPSSWWEATAMSTLEFQRYELRMKETKVRCAVALVENPSLFIPSGSGMPERGRRRFHHLEVETAYRQRGLGSYLIHAVLEAAKKDRVKYVEILVPEDNSSASKMFLRLEPESTAVGLVYRKELRMTNYE